MLLTDFLTCVINQGSPSPPGWSAVLSCCRHLHSLWYCVHSPGHSLKLVSYRYCFHPHHHSQCPHFMHCLGQAISPISLLHATTYSLCLDHSQPELWLSEFAKYMVCLENTTYFSFWVFQLLQKHQSTSFHTVYNVFKYAQNITMSIFYCHKYFPTMTLKGAEKIWNQRQFRVKVCRYKRKLENGFNPLLFFFMAKHDTRSCSWGVLALAESYLRAVWNMWTSASKRTHCKVHAVKTLKIKSHASVMVRLRNCWCEYTHLYYSCPT